MKTDKKYSKGKKEKNKNSDDEEWLPHKKEKSRKNKTSKTSKTSKEIKKRKAEDKEGDEFLKEQKEQEGQNRKIRTGDPMMDDIVTTYIIDTVSELFDEKRKAVISLEEWKRSEEEQLRINREMEKEIEANSYGPKIWTVRERKFITLKFDKVFTSLEELISLGETFDPSVIYVSVINMLKLKSVLENIKYLSSLIGLKSFKDSVLKQLLYILTLPQITDNDFPMLHGCIYGPPGVGKTEIAKTLGNIYSSCGLLKKNIFKIAKREDFVGEFVGSTSIKTRKLLESCIGGVLLIDEVYSFGSEDSRDIFSKEAIDCLNVFLTEHSHEFICIIAGYKDAIEKCFFSINQGLRRRFTNNFIISPYTHEELSQIFLKFFTDRKYVVSISVEQITEFFKNEIRNFPFHAGDVKTFMEKCLIYKGNLRMIEEKEGWYVISKKDMDEGYKIYLEERVPIGFEVEENDFKSMFV